MIQVRNETYNGHRIAEVFHDASSKNLVIFCHGFRGTSTGPRRFFVGAAKKLAEQGVSSLRFDQYGSGNSDGTFEESRFDDWIMTTKAIVASYIKQGYRVALFGQSMGASTVLNVASEVQDITAVVAWVPDAKIHAPDVSGEYMEEAGERVGWEFWQQAHEAHMAEKLRSVAAPVYVVQCTADEYVDEANRQAIIDCAQPHHVVENFESYPHSSWAHDQAEAIIDKSVTFLTSSFRA